LINKKLKYDLKKNENTVCLIKKVRTFVPARGCNSLPSHSVRTGR